MDRRERMELDRWLTTEPEEPEPADDVDPMDWARAVDLQFVWEDDWSIGMTHAEFFGVAYEDGEPATCESCRAVLGRETLASLGCIDDATESYRREIEKDLAYEALAEVDSWWRAFR